MKGKLTYRGVHDRIINHVLNPAYSSPQLLEAFEEAILAGCHIYVQETDPHDLNRKLERAFMAVGRYNDFRNKRVRTMDNYVKRERRRMYQAYLNSVTPRLLRELPPEIKDRKRKDDTNIGCTELCFSLIRRGYDFKLISRPSSLREDKKDADDRTVKEYNALEPMFDPNSFFHQEGK